jgi:hypothetical protein
MGFEHEKPDVYRASIEFVVAGPIVSVREDQPQYTVEIDPDPDSDPDTDRGTIEMRASRESV